MSKRNKGTTRSQRSTASMAQRAREYIAEDRRERGAKIMEAIGDMDCATGHALLMVVIAAMEGEMDRQGIAITAKQRVTGNGFVPCRRCAFAEIAGEDECGKYTRCTMLRAADGGELLSCRTDGCSFGRQREQ